MKRAVLFFLLFFSINSNSWADDSLGKFIQIMGDVDLTDISSGSIFTPGVGSRVNKLYKIRTASKSFTEILLDDGNKLFLRETTVVFIHNLKKSDNDPPTKIEVLTGKVRINKNKSKSGRDMVILTPTALAGIPAEDTEIGVITSQYETKIAVFEGKADIANSQKEVIKSYTISKKEESSVKINQGPTEPIVLPAEILNNWLDYYDVIDTKKIVIKGKGEDSLLDYILRKRKY